MILKQLTMLHRSKLYWYSEPDGFGIRRMIPASLALQLPFHCFAFSGECKFDYQNDDRYRFRRKYRPTQQCSHCSKCAVNYQGIQFSPRIYPRHTDNMSVFDLPDMNSQLYFDSVNDTYYV